LSAYNKGICRVIVQISGLKAAHFYAPRGPINHYVSGTMPPGLSLHSPE